MAPHGRHRRLLRPHHGWPHTIKTLDSAVSPLDMMGLIGMAQVIATIAHGIQGLRRGTTTWDWPKYNAFMVVSPWQSPTYFMTTKPTSQRAYDIDSFLVRASDLDWLKGDRLKDLQAQARAGHKWIPAQQLPYNETIYMHTPPTARTGLHRVSTIRIVQCTRRACLGTSWPWTRNRTATGSNIGHPRQPTKHQRSTSMWCLRTQHASTESPVAGGRGAWHPRYRC